MSAQQFPLSTIVTISVSETPSGVSVFNASNLALFTTDTPSPAFSSGYKIYLDPNTVGIDFGTSSVTYKMALAVFSQVPNILLPGGYLVVIPFTSSETLAAALVRTATLVQYFGVMTTQIESQVDMLAAAAVIQAAQLIGFFAQYNPTSVNSGGSLDLLRTGDFTQSRGLFYDDSSSAGLNALLYQAAYASRALSTVFSGSNTTQSMQLKQLSTIQPDPNITPTIEALAQTAGADTYLSFAGFSACDTSGANDFFDNQYNLQWFRAALQVAYFNYLASTSTKVPQTEAGMDGIKNALRLVCLQGVNNGYLAPGVWNSATTFGNPVLLLQNVANFGFYIYSTPIAQQSQVDRAARVAPLVQIAVKLAGGINTGSVVVVVNP